MSFLRRLLGSPSSVAKSWPPPGPITAWPTELHQLTVDAYLFEPTGRVVVDVVGEASYQGTLERIGGGKTIDGMRNRDHTAVLLPEPTNQWDTNAVRVIVASPGVTGGTVGYLSRENAVAYRPIIDRLAALGKVVAIRASLSGGWDRGAEDRGSIGVVLRLGTVDACETEMIASPPTPAWA